MDDTFINSINCYVLYAPRVFLLIKWTIVHNRKPDLVLRPVIYCMNFMLPLLRAVLDYCEIIAFLYVTVVQNLLYIYIYIYIYRERERDVIISIFSVSRHNLSSKTNILGAN